MSRKRGREEGERTTEAMERCLCQIDVVLADRVSGGIRQVYWILFPSLTLTDAGSDVFKVPSCLLRTDHYISLSAGDPWRTADISTVLGCTAVSVYFSLCITSIRRAPFW